MERYPEFEYAEGDDGGVVGGGEYGEEVRRKAGGLVLVHETVSLLWKGRDTIELGRMMAEANGHGGGIDKDSATAFVSRNPFAGTDFEGMGR